MSWAAVIVGGSMVVGAYISSESSKKASSTQAEAARDAASAQVYSADQALTATRETLAQQEKLTKPWREAGERGLEDLEAKMDAGPGSYKESPGYRFQLGEGLKTIENMAAKRGSLLSGATGKALARYSGDFALKDYDKHLARYYQSLTPYQSLSGVGQTSAAQLAGLTGEAGAQTANLLTQSGEAEAAGYLGAGKAKASGYLSQGKIWSDAAQSGGGLIASKFN